VIVADTDILIDALEGRPAVAAVVEDLLRSRRIATTAISRIELGAGAVTPEEGRRVESLIAAIPVLPVDGEAGRLAGERGAVLRATGASIPLADLAIASVCLALDVPLLTRNQKHYRRIEGLRLADVPAG